MKQKRKEKKLAARIKQFEANKNNANIPAKVRQTYHKPGSIKKS